MRSVLSSLLDYITSLAGAPVWVKIIALLALIALCVLSFSSCNRPMYRSPSLHIAAEKAVIDYSDSLYFNPYYSK